MEKLLAYLNSLTPEDREAFAKRCETTVGYLRKACSVNQRLGEGLCLRIGKESGGVIKLEDLRPDIDWEYLRVAIARDQAPATVAQDAIKTVTTEAEGLRTGAVRRRAVRMAKGLPVDGDRRSQVIPPLQAPVVGLA